MLVALVVVIGWGQQTARGAGGLLLSAGVLLAGYPLALTAHELGHAAAAWAFGWPVNAVRVGPLLAEGDGRRWRWRLNWRANWLNGVALTNAVRPTRGRLAVFSMAGPAVNLACGGLTLFALAESLPGWVRSAAVAVAAWSLFLGWGSLLPLRHRGLDTDGLALLLLWLNPGWIGLPNSGATRQQTGLSPHP